MFLPQSGPGSPVIHTHLTFKMHSSHPQISKSLSPLQQQLKNTSSKSHQFTSPKLHHLNRINQVRMRLWICSIWGKITLHLWTVKLKKKLSAPTYNAGTIIGHTKKGENRRRKRVSHPKQFQNPVSKISSLENNTLWPTASPSGTKAPFFMKCSRCFQSRSFIILFPTYRIWHPQPSFSSPSLLSFQSKLALLLSM